MSEIDIFSGEGVAEAENQKDQAQRIVQVKAPWVARWRPHTIQDVILPDNIKNMLEYGLENNEFTHMILHSGKPGTGKTTTARAIPTQLNTDYDFYAGAECNADIFDSIRAFASQKTMDGKARFVIIDEADRPKAQDPAKFYNGLNSLIEATESTLRFILTCNNLYKIPEPIISRCSPISFAYDLDDVSLKKQLFKRMKQIADVEVIQKGGTVNDETLKQIARHYYPDFRSIIQTMFINYLEHKGNIDGVPTFVTHDHIEKIWGYLTTFNYMEMRQFVSGTIVDYQSVFAPLGDYIIENLPPLLRLNFAVLLAEYQYRAAAPAVDQEINMNGFLAKTMQLLQTMKTQ